MKLSDYRLQMSCFYKVERESVIFFILESASFCSGDSGWQRKVARSGTCEVRLADVESGDGPSRGHMTPTVKLAQVQSRIC
jgi:hypothetical protein